MFSSQNSDELIKVIKRLGTFNPDEVLFLSSKLISVVLKKFDVNNITIKVIKIFSLYKLKR